MKRFITLLSLVFFASPSFAGALNCQTRIGFNGIYNVFLDTDSMRLEVNTPNGTKWRGITNFSHSSYTGDDFYFLAVDYTASLQVWIKRLNSNETEPWLCLDQNTCGLCRESK